MPLVLPSRRDVLRGFAGITVAAVLTGCSRKHGNSPGAAGPAAGPDPDLALLATVIADKSELIAAYDAAVARFPQLEDRVRPLRADHTAHLAALTGFRPDVPAATPTVPAAATPSAPPPAAGKGAQNAAVEDLATAELAAAGRRVGQCRAAADPKLARLLASIGGCEAAHTALLRAAAS